MSALLALASIIAWVLTLGCFAAAAYLVILTVCAALARRQGRAPASAPAGRLVVVIPAHNEAGQLPALVDSFARQSLPRHLYEVHVVADNCTDETAAVARAAGFTVHERSDPVLRGKGHALDWLIQRIPGSDIAAYVFVDADSQVSPNFMETVARHFGAGARALQVFYGVTAPETSWSKAARAAAMLLINGVRPLGRSAMGGSAGVKGTGMAFAPDLIRDHRWGALLAEDAAFHLDIVLKGDRVVFDRQATVHAHVPATLRGAEVQNQRWEAGRLQLVRLYAPRLLARVVGGSVVALDALADLLVPPLSVLAAAIVAALALSAVTGPAVLVWLNLLSLCGVALHVMAGLAIMDATRVHYRALLMAPVMILWKVGLYLPLLAGRRPTGWIKTERD